MEEHYNSAYRIFTTLQQAKESKATWTAGAVWASVFQIDEPDSRERDFRVIEGMSALRDEIKLFKGSISAHGIKVQRFAATFQALEDVLNPLTCPHLWNDYAPLIHAGVLQMFHGYIDMMGTDSPQMEDGQINELIARLRELEQQLFDAPLPESIRQMLLRHIQLLLVGLRTFRVRGARAFRKAYTELIVAIGEDKALYERALTEEEAKNYIEEIRKAAAIMLHVAATVVTAHEFIDVAASGYRLLTGTP